MSANLQEVIVSARSFPNVLALPVSARIGGIEIETNIEELHHDSLHLTDHPVESGTSITDHSYKRPAEVELRCGWSNSSLKALIGIVSGFFAGGSMSKADYVSGVYSQLLKLQQSREPFSITTSLRQYDNMLMTSLAVRRDKTTSSIIMVQATCREVIIVNTQSKQLPALESQANPASTAEVDNVGGQQVITGFPAPGGSVTPTEW
jgi:hypothetical protein